MASVIIPAHNEEAVISRSIGAVLSQATPKDEIFVCVNGCTDGTEQVAKTFAPRVTVLSTSYASKVYALNQGDAAACSFPRVYLDADVELTEGCLDLLKKALTDDRFLAAAPEPQMDLSRSSWAVRAYYDVWLSLPYCQRGMMGAGVYAMSKEGRNRFDRFPELIADDGFVRALFQEHERCRVVGARVLVRAPVSLKYLLRIKIRSRIGQMQLALEHPELKQNEVKSYSHGIWSTIRNPLRWPAAMIYLWVSVITRILGRHELSRLSQYRWQKDLSSRGDVEASNRGSK